MEKSKKKKIKMNENNITEKNWTGNTGVWNQVVLSWNGTS
jgi:hypothetical protein